MFTIRNKKVQAAAGKAAGQAAIELAVFGAVLVFIVGTIVQYAVNNGYTQNENFKAMRLALLSSWQGSESAQGKGALANITRNNASIIFVEDRLSPEFNKYGDLDRNPFVAQGAGSFSYELLYPGQPGVDPTQNLVSVMDVWINGQHFPLTTASFASQTLTRPASCTYPPGSCLQNQCLRNQREWVGAGSAVNESQFDNVIPVPLNTPVLPGLTEAQTIDQIESSNASQIFTELNNEGFITLPSPTATSAQVNFSALTPTFKSWFVSKFPGMGRTQLNQIQSILQSGLNQPFGYKLFYTMVPNDTTSTPAFSPTPPADCGAMNSALCSTLTVTDAFGASFTNNNGDMQYDLQRLGDYSPTGVESKFPPVATCSSITVTPNLRCYIAWQWAATAGTSAASIGLDPSSNQYPQYDIDGRLKPVTIYAIDSTPAGTAVVYEDPDGGDIDPMWDTTSCGPKPGLQGNAQIFTFTKDGTYLKIVEGKLYDPETDRFVRSANQRDTVDLIQRMVQFSNNTGDFCNGTTPQPTVQGLPNEVEVCVDGISSNCFSNQTNITSTCFDTSDNLLFVRSRLQDRRGHYWMTDIEGNLKVK